MKVQILSSYNIENLEKRVETFYREYNVIDTKYSVTYAEGSRFFHSVMILYKDL